MNIIKKYDNAMDGHMSVGRSLDYYAGSPEIRTKRCAKGKVPLEKTCPAPIIVV